MNRAGAFAGALPDARALTEALLTGEAAPLGALGIVLGRMRANHGEQWTAEDRCRVTGIAESELGRLKRHIDRLNGTRSVLIDEVDAWVADHVPQSPDAIPHTETYGALLDRIVISGLRSDRVAVPGANRRGAAAQHLELLRSYDLLIGDVRRGNRRFPNWRSLKRYGPRDLPGPRIAAENPSRG